MPRDAEKVRRRLQDAALALFEERGYEQVTAADIAEAAQVTQRTFFRHFPDKREVLFGGEEEFIDTLVQAVRQAPQQLGPWSAMQYALHEVVPLFVRNRDFARPRQQIIASHPALQERAQTKMRGVAEALTGALHERGVADRLAALTAQVGMAAMHQAVSSWFASERASLGDHIDQAFEDVRELSSGG